MDLQDLKDSHISLPKEYGVQYHVVIDSMNTYKKLEAKYESAIAEEFLKAKHSGMTLDEAKAKAKKALIELKLQVIDAEARWLHEKATLETLYERMVGIRELSAFERKEMYIAPDGEINMKKYLKG